MNVNVRELFDIPTGVVTESQVNNYLSSKYTNGRTVPYMKANQYQQGILVCLLIYIYHKLKKKLKDDFCNLPNMEQYDLKVLVSDCILLLSVMTEGEDIWTKCQHMIWKTLFKFQRRIFGFKNININTFKRIYDGNASEPEIRNLLHEIHRLVIDIFQIDCDENYLDFKNVIEMIGLSK